MNSEGSNSNEQPKAKEQQQFLNKNLSEASSNLHTSEQVHSAVVSIEEFSGLNSSEFELARKLKEEEVDLLSESDSEDFFDQY